MPISGSWFNHYCMIANYTNAITSSLNDPIDSPEAGAAQATHLCQVVTAGSTGTRGSMGVQDTFLHISTKTR